MVYCAVMQSDLDASDPKRPMPGPEGQFARWAPLSGAELAGALPQFADIVFLGRGGIGAVYKARQLSVDRIVAVKVLVQPPADDGLKFAERFKQEARAMARLSHPGIVTVHDAGETSGARVNTHTITAAAM